jgi:predicted nucleic acid-binding protein
MMSRASLETAIPSATPVVLDTSVVLAYLNGNERASPVAAVVLDDFVRNGRNTAIISSVTVTETLVRPFKAGAPELGIAEDFLLHFPNLKVDGVDYAVAREAARLRAESNLRTPDALIIATASVHNIPIVVANDDQWTKPIATSVPSVTLCHLDAHAPI